MRFASASFHRAMSSSRSSNRRGQTSWRPRSFCGVRPSPAPRPEAEPPAAEGGGEFVSGDSHFRTVRDANYDLRHRGGGGGRGRGRGRGRGGATWNANPHRPPPPASPYGHPPYGYGASPPHGYIPHPYGYGAPPPPYGPPAYPYGHHQPPSPRGGFPQNFFYMANMHHQPQQPAVSLMPRLADYRRSWRFAPSQPPRQAEKFKVLSYNILADYLAMEHQSLYSHIPQFILNWNSRKERLLFEFGLWSPDIMCLQEVDKFSDLEEVLASQGYSGTWKMRTGKAVDGCAVFWRSNRFQLRYKEHIEFNKLALRDNVAQLCVLESLVQGNVENNPCLSTSSDQPRQGNQIVICNIHVLYNPRRGEVKLGQVRTVLDQAYAVSKIWNDAPVIICGDFNSTPKSPLYNFISEQKLNLCGLARNQISRQYSATSSENLYTGSNVFRSRPYFQSINSTEEGVSSRDEKPPMDTSNAHVTEKSCSVGRGNVLSDTSLESCFNAESNNNDCKIPCSNTSNFGEQGLLNENSQPYENCSVKSDLVGPSKDAQSSDAPVHSTSLRMDTTRGHELSVGVDNFNERRSCGAPNKPGEVNFTDIPSSTSMVNREISQSNLNEIVHNTCFDSSYESPGNSQRNLFGNAIPEKVACASERHTESSLLDNDTKGPAIAETLEEKNIGQLHVMMNLSNDSAGEKEKPKPCIKGESWCIDNGIESPDSGDSRKLADSHGEVSTTRIEAASSSEDPSNLPLPEKSMHCQNSPVSDSLSISAQLDSAKISQCSDSDPLFCFADQLERDNHAFKDVHTVTEVSYSDEKSDPSFLEELRGDVECEIQDEDLLPTTSDNNCVSPCVSTGKYTYYDPYLWTSEEIKAATGNEECTSIEHKLILRSVYTDVEDYAGTKDANREPEVTSYHRQFMGTVDYIWCSEGLQTVSVLDTIPKNILQQTSGFPTKKWGSDHIALVCQLAFTKEFSTK